MSLTETMLRNALRTLHECITTTRAGLPDALKHADQLLRATDPGPIPDGNTALHIDELRMAFKASQQRGTFLVLDAPAQYTGAPDGWLWMTHPSRNEGKPIPVQVWEDENGKLYRPFDEHATDFEWSERDDEWKQVAPLPCDDDDQERQALRDMLDDARTELDMLRQALGVAYEPHQSLRERTLDMARENSTRLNAMIENEWQLFEINGQYSVREACGGEEMTTVIGAYPNGFESGRAAIDAAMRAGKVKA